ncbi:MAG: acyltransferase family protein [Bacteroidia bacterium]
MKPITFIPSLTPLRGIAATLVVLFHFDLFVGPIAPAGNMMVDKLYLMVDLFFVLSGFIMYHVYGSWFAQGIGQESFLTFMKARFARLYPLHLLMLIYMIGWACALWIQLDKSAIPEIVQSILDPKAIPTSLLLIQAWGMHFNAPWNTASWSISVEWLLYLVFPFLVLFMARYKNVAKWILGGVALGGLLSIMYWIQPLYELLWAEEFGMEGGRGPTNTIDLITGPALLRGLCGFIVGMLSYEAYNKDWMKSTLQKGFWFLTILLGMFVLWIGDLLPDVLAVGLFGILILHSAYVEGLTKKILNNRVFTYLGDISFSIYMVHIPLILSFFMYNMMQGNMPDPGAEPDEINLFANWAGALIFLGVSIGVASLTYRFVELPMRRRLKAYFSASKSELA